jgi:integrase
MSNTIIIDNPAPAVATPGKKRSILTAVEIAKFKAAPVTLTPKLIAKLAKCAAPQGQRVTIRDALVPGFGLRLTDKGHLSYILAARYPGSPNWSRREIAACDATSLEKARDTARDWIELLGKGSDPRAEMEQRQRDEARKEAHTFAAVAEAFIDERVIGPNNPDPNNPVHPIQRKWKWTARTIRDPFIKAWKETPIANISRDQVLAIIKAKARKHPAEARSQLATIKSLFSWALDQSYGLERSPAADIKPRNVIGEKTSGDRVLSDDELRALWTVASETAYPIGPVYKLLMLSGLRLNEVARAERGEFNLDPANPTWVIPASRMKGRNVGADGRRAKPHLVPLTPAMLQVLDDLPPRFKHGDLLFTTTRGKKPVWLGSKVKDAIDARMQEQLERIAAERGNVPKPLEPWVNHDIRRSIRTRLSGLKIQQEVSEAILAHVKKGIVGVYDLYQYSDEKRTALEAWAARLHQIVNPPAPEPADSNIVHPRFGKATS